MNATKIEWVRGPQGERGYTLNPTGGCSGKGCAVSDVCYARRIAKRFKQRCLDCYEFTPHYHMERLNHLKKLKHPSGVFLGSMTDIFDDEFNYGYIMTKLYDVFNSYRQHRFYLLTKQPQNVRLFNYPNFPPNVWFGVTVNRRSDLWRLNALRQVNARIRFVSFEPLLEDLSDINLDGVDWLIIGAQTRPEKQPDSDWVNRINDQARSLRIPIFLKNNLHYCPGLQEFPREA